MPSSTAWWWSPCWSVGCLHQALKLALLALVLHSIKVVAISMAREKPQPLFSSDPTFPPKLLGTHRLHKKACSGLWDYAASINSKAQWTSWEHLVPSVWFLAVEFKATQEHIDEMLWDLEMTSQTSNLGPCSLDPQTLIWWKRVSLILHYYLILDPQWHFLEWLP